MLGALLSGGARGILEGAASVIGKFKLDPGVEAELNVELEKLVASRFSEIEQTGRRELEAKERVLVAELAQGDGFTKRARPWVVYAGLLFIGINYVVFPILSRLVIARQSVAESFTAAQLEAMAVATQPLPDLPTEFWMAWGGICTTWVIGRSLEKRGVGGPLIRGITGSKGT